MIYITEFKESSKQKQQRDFLTSRADGHGQGGIPFSVHPGEKAEKKQAAKLKKNIERSKTFEGVRRIAGRGDGNLENKLVMDCKKNCGRTRQPSAAARSRSNGREGGEQKDRSSSPDVREFPRVSANAASKRYPSTVS